MSRGIASLVCLLLFVASVGLVIVLLSIQLSSLLENLDAMKSRVYNLFNNFRNWVDQTLGIDNRQQKEIIEKQETSPGQMLFKFASGMVGIAINTILVLVYMYMFLLYRNHIKKFVLKLVARHEKSDTDEVVHKTVEVSQKYLSGLAVMIGLLWVMYGIGFSVIGVENAIFFAVLCGLLEIIPFIGNLTGTSITLLAVIAQGGGSDKIIGVLIVYGLVQFIQTYILEPLIVGEQVNINPLFTIMAIVLGEMVWGVAGMILAIPLLGMIKIICDNHPDLQPYGFLIGPENPKKKKTSVIDYLKRIFNRSK